MSQSSIVDYYVTIDSEFRDNEKYPIETDFAVKFKETTSDIPFVKGVPINDSFFSNFQIDPNYVNSQFRVLAGKILNVKKLSDVSFIICGLIIPSETQNMFKLQEVFISNNSTSYLDVVTLPLNNEFESSVFLCRVSLLSGYWVLNWFIYLDEFVQDSGLQLGYNVYSGYFADNVDYFNNASILSSGTTNRINNISQLSPPSQDFSIQFIGSFTPQISGIYVFELTSDDASYMWLNSTAIRGFTTGNSFINNGGIHSVITKTNEINLIAGSIYPIRIQYGQLSGNKLLSLKIYNKEALTLNKTEFCAFDLDENNNIYFTFNFTSEYFTLQKISTEGGSNVLFNVQNPSSYDNTSCQAVFAFDINGNSYYVDGHTWGYHIIQASDDILKTEENGRLGIKVDEGLNLYLSGNTNPFEPEYTRNKVSRAFDTDEYVSYVTIYKNNNDDDCALVYSQRYAATSYGVAQCYSIQTSGTTFLTKSRSYWSGATDYYNIHDDGIYFIQYLNTMYIIGLYGSFSDIKIGVGSVNLSTGSLTITGVAPNYTQLNNAACYTISSVRYETSIYTTFIYTNSNTTPNVFRILRLDLTNLSAGFSVVANSSPISITQFDDQMSLTTMIENDIMYVCCVNTIGEVNIIKTRLTLTTCTILSKYSSSSIVETGLNTMGSFMYYNSLKYYLVLGTISKNFTKIYDITDLSAIDEQSTINSLTTDKISLYKKDSYYFLVDNLRDIYNINNTKEPELLSSAYPKILDNEIIFVHAVSEQYQQVISIIRDTDLPSADDRQFLTNYKFIYSDNQIKSIHYNQNLENQINNPNYVTFDVVNQDTGQINVKQNTFTPQSLIDNGLLLWLDASNSNSITFNSSKEVSEWKDLSGNNYHMTPSTSTKPVFDQFNSQINFENSPMEGLYSDIISPKYMIVVSKQWNDQLSVNVVENSTMPLFEIGDSTSHLGYYKMNNAITNTNRSYAFNINKSYVSSIPANSQSYTFPFSTTNPSLTDTGEHPYLYNENYNTNFITNSFTKYVVCTADGNSPLNYSVNGTQFLSSPSNTQLFTNQAGYYWTARTPASNNNWLSVTYGNGLFVAVSISGTGNRVMTSLDGINWTSRVSAADNGWHSVTYGAGIFVAVAYSGAGNRVMTSPDGINWTSRTSAVDNSWMSVTYGNGLFVAVAESGTGDRVMTSSDGINWTSRTSATDNNWLSVTYGNGLFVAVAESGTGDRVMTSPDGIVWTSRISAADNNWRSVTYANGLFVAVAASGSSNRVMYSSDGISWSTTITPDLEWYGVSYGNGLFIAVAYEGLPVNNRVMTSADGINWTLQYEIPSGSWRSICFGNNIFVVVSDTSNYVMTSGTDLGLFTKSYTSAWGNSICVAGGEGPNTLAYSVDGINWIGLGRNIFTTSCRTILFANGLWLAGGNGINTLAYSYNGINWIGLGKSVFTNICYGLDWNGNDLYVAVGSGGNNLAYSNDPTLTWNGVINRYFNPGLSVKYSNVLNRWIACGDPTSSRIIYSNDGISWFACNGDSTFTILRSIDVDNNGYCIAVGQSNGVTCACSSIDGINWNNMSNIPMTKCYGIRWSGLRWILTGSVTDSSNTIAYSNDGLTWIGLGKGLITNIGYNVSIPLSITYTEYSKGIFENVYENQVNNSLSFDGVSTINNQSLEPNPVDSNGWRDVTAEFRIGSSTFTKSLSRELVYTNPVQTTGNPIYVNSMTGSIDNLNGTISEIIVLDFVPNTTLRQQIQAYLMKKYNLWSLYVGINLYKPTPYGSTIVTIDGSNSTLNFLNFSDILNIDAYTLPFSIIDQTNDPGNLYGVQLNHSDIIQFIHFVDNESGMIYFYLAFTYNSKVYLILVVTDLLFNYQNSTYVQLADYVPATQYQSNVPVSNIVCYSDGNYMKCIVQYSYAPFDVRFYSYTKGSNGTLSLIHTISLNYPYAVNYSIQCGGVVVPYTTNGITTYIFYAFFTEGDWSGYPGLQGNIMAVDLSNYSFNPTPLYFNVVMGSNKNGIQYFSYPDGRKYIFCKKTAGSNETYVFDVTSYTVTPTGLPNVLEYKIITENTFNTVWSQGNYLNGGTFWPLTDNEVPLTIYQNPVDKKIISLINYNPYLGPLNSYALLTPTLVQQYFTYRDVTDLTNIPGSNIIPITTTNLGNRISLIKYGFSGQKVYAACLITNPTSMKSSYLKFYDVTNIEYATTYYQNSSIFATPNETVYDNIYGVGVGYINKIDSKGKSEWLSYIGGDADIFNSLKINISNIDINPQLSHIYLTGGWNFKIETFNTINSKENKIYSYGSGYNGFLAKLAIKDGKFEWLLPSIGANNDYFERLGYIKSKDYICVVNHYESSILLVYKPQLSSSGPFINPNDVSLNLANTSSETSSLIAFTPTGEVAFSTKLYSNIELQSVTLYDLMIDEESSTKRIYVVGLTNATVINSTDSTKLETQKLYNDINHLNQHALIIYQYDIDGVYESSQNIIFPENLDLSVSDIKTFSLLNRVVTFVNMYSLSISSNDTIKIYNPDGTLATTLSATPNIELLEKTFQSIIVQYYYDNRYIDKNGGIYSKVICMNSSVLPQETNYLNNYNLFLLGSLFDSTLYLETNQTLIADSFPLNKNFLIRTNFVDNDKYSIILNQIIKLSTLDRINLSGTNNNYWSGSVVKSTLSNILSYDTTLVPNSSNTLTITNIYGEPLNSNNEYYIMIYDGANIRYIKVNQILYNNTTETYTMNISNTNDLLVGSSYYGPYIYLGVKNLNANYTIQFCPTPLRSEAKFKCKLNSLIIPNRKIRNSYLGGSRDLNDFRYLILEIYNEDDSGLFSERINNNDFYNNPNYISYVNRCKGSFTVPITGINVSSASNFVILSSIDIPIITFLPGYYNIRMKLKDIYGNVVQFDSTPNSEKQSDNIFINSSINSPLMQITANITFTRL